MSVYELPKDKVIYNYRYFLPYAPEWGSEALCRQRLNELVAFCDQAAVREVQFFVNTLPGTYYMPAHNAQEQLHWAAWMKDIVAPKLRENGICYQLNYQMILGAGNDGLDMRDEYDWEFMKNQYGQECFGAPCPIGEKYRKTMGEMLRLWADTKPAVIWIDDDFRMHNHGMGANGPDFYCYCDNHLKAFAEFCGRKFTREEITAEIMKPGEPSQWRLKWMDFLNSTMVDTAAWIEREIHSVSPDTRIALMTGNPDMHSFEGRNWNETLTAISGTQKPMIRPCLGCYTTTNFPIRYNTISYWMMEQSMEILEQKFGLGGVDFGPEIEAVAFTTWCRSVANERYVLTLAQLLGANLITLSLSNLDGSAIDEEPTIAPMLRDMKPKLQPLADLNLRSWKKHGVVFLNNADMASKIQAKEGWIYHDMTFKPKWEMQLLECGIPAYFRSSADAADGDDVVVLKENSAWAPTDDELKKMLSKRVLLDGGAAEVLCKRGFGEYIGVKALEEHRGKRIHAEKYLGNVLPDVKEDRVPQRGEEWFSLELDGATLLSQFIDAKFRHHVGSTIFENALGGRVAVYANSGEIVKGVFGSHARLRWLHAVLDWLSDGRFPVLAKVPHQCLTIMRSEGDTTLLALANLGADYIEEHSFELGPGQNVSSVQVLDDSGKWIDADYSCVSNQLNIKYGIHVYDWLIARVTGKRE